MPAGRPEPPSPDAPTLSITELPQLTTPCALLLRWIETPPRGPLPRAHRAACAAIAQNHVATARGLRLPPLTHPRGNPMSLANPDHAVVVLPENVPLDADNVGLSHERCNWVCD